MNDLKIEDYKHKIEMHAHTKPTSPCSSVTPERLVEIYDELGYSAVCITNHMQNNGNHFFNSQEELLKSYLDDWEKCKKAAEGRNINVILGVEFRGADSASDFLTYGIDEEFLKKAIKFCDGPYEEYYRQMKNDDNVIIQAHPFRPGQKLYPRELIDGIETFNVHPHHNSCIGLAAQYARENDFKLTIAGNDFHDEPCQGLSAILTKTQPKDSFEMAKILKSRDFLLEISGNIIIPWGFREEE